MAISQKNTPIYNYTNLGTVKFFYKCNMSMNKEILVPSI